MKYIIIIIIKTQISSKRLLIFAGPENMNINSKYTHKLKKIVNIFLTFMKFNKYKLYIKFTINQN